MFLPITLIYDTMTFYLLTDLLELKTKPNDFQTKLRSLSMVASEVQKRSMFEELLPQEIWEMSIRIHEVVLDDAHASEKQTCHVSRQSTFELYRLNSCWRIAASTVCLHRPCMTFICLLHHSMWSFLHHHRCSVPSYSECRWFGLQCLWTPPTALLRQKCEGEFEDSFRIRRSSCGLNQTPALKQSRYCCPCWVQLGSWV